MSDQIAKRKYHQSWHGMTPKPNNFIQTPKLKQFAGPVKRRLFGRKAEKENAESSVGLDCSKDMFEDHEEFAPSSPKVEDAAETKPVPSNTVPAPLFFKMSNEVLSESESESEESPALEEEQSTADEETTGEEQTSTAEEQSTTEEETTTATVKETTSTTEEVTTATAEEQLL